ncbi:MAG: Fpg/Nei family DNA glycosylase [Anaerolineales bacterium]
MPELPELEVVREVLSRRVVGRRVERVSLAPKGAAVVVRDLSGRGFAGSLAGAAFTSVSRRGKFLLFTLEGSPLRLAVNPKLTGRFQLAQPGGRKAGPVWVTLHLGDPPEELRFVDSKRMGQIYLTEDLAQVPTFSEMGPEALDVSLDEFRSRLRPFRGEIKGVLVNARFLAGIGNAYADEILWQSRLHPYRKRPGLSPEEVERLYHAMRETLAGSIEKVRQAMGEDIHLKPRDFFAVHMRRGQACPRCGTTISAVTANQKITNFCRTCQPGGLIWGLGTRR